MPTSLQNPLVVPIRVDALWSDGTTPLRAPLEDFSRMDKALQAQYPWLGDTLVPDLESVPLPLGMHLHWTLPDALTHGHTVYQITEEVCHELTLNGVPQSLLKSLQGKAGKDAEYTRTDMEALLTSLAAPAFTPLSQSQWDTAMDASKLAWDPLLLQIYAPLVMKTAAHMKLPPVPDRWLVLRQGGTGPDVSWIVESDRLTAADAPPPTGAAAGPCQMQVSITVPTDNKGIPVTPAVVPTHGWQHLGLTFADASTWSEDTDPATPRLRPLTAAGSGLPEFAAFYPSCQGVFGLCDAAADAKTAYTYTVIGWFSLAADDPISSGKDLATQLTALKWSCAAAKACDGSLYVARAVVNGAQCPLMTDKDGGGLLGENGVNVAVGNSTGQALAAALAAQFTGGVEMEKLLDAAQAGALRHLDEPDGTARMEQAMHQQGFRPSHGGTFWSVRQKKGDSVGLSAALPVQTAAQAAAAAKAGKPPPKSDSAVPVPAEAQLTLIADQLNAVNQAQRQYDGMMELCVAQRELLFADWCRSLQLNSPFVDPFGHQIEHNPCVAGMLKCADGTTPLMSKAYTMVLDGVSLLSSACLGNDKQNALIQWAGILYQALSTLQQSLHGLPLEMTAHPAPRFWQPHDPVVLFYDQGGQSLLTATPATGTEKDPNGYLLCLAAPTPIAASGPPPKGWTAAFQGLITALASATGTVPPPQNITAASWRPLFLEWSAAYLPCQSAGELSMTNDGTNASAARSAYGPDFLKNFQPDPDGIDLQLVSDSEIAQDPASHAEYKGRVLLSPRAVSSMKDRIYSLLGTQKPPQAGQDAIFPGALGKDDTASAWLNQVLKSGSQTLSQALDGYHDHMLMRQRIRQLSPFDPRYPQQTTSPGYLTAWDPVTQSFCPLIGRCNAASPVPGDHYHPIRGGVCEISDLTLVDRFGQTRRWQIDASKPMALSRTLPLYKNTTPGDKANTVTTFHLPPRLTQPSRLLFRWIAADDSGVESAVHPSTTPVLGWIMLDRVDANILFFAATGELLGWVGWVDSKHLDSDSKHLKWQPMPGAAALNATMQALQTEFCTKAGYFDDIATALLTIEPHSHRQHRAASVLMSRPLAICAASLRLQLKGTPAPHQGYASLVEAVETNGFAAPTVLDPSQTCNLMQRETCDFEKVQVPIRLGDVSMEDDGLIAWWPADANSLPTTAWNLVDSCPAPLPLTPDPTTAATQVLLLLDPRACVHASSGILPVKSITLPPELYAEALKKMELIFTAAPVLTPAGTWTLPIPAELSSTWSWLPDLQSTTVPQPLSGKVDDRAHLPPDPAVLRRGWLRAKLQEKKGDQ